MTDPATMMFLLNVFVCADGTAMLQSCRPAGVNYGPYATEQECTAAVPELQLLWPRMYPPARYAFECFGVRIR